MLRILGLDKDPEPRYVKNYGIRQKSEMLLCFVLKLRGLDKNPESRCVENSEIRQES